MAENVPPATTAGQNSTTANSAGSGPEQMQNRGIPYYEKLRRELRETIQKKRLMDKNMAALEESIYRFEQSYLEETGAGNIIKGFDNYIKGASGVSGIGAGSSLGSMAGGGGGGSGGGGPMTRRKTAVQDCDRVFSRSSASFMRDSPAPSSANTTPSHAPTPTSASIPGTNANRDNNTPNNTTTNNNNSAPSSIKGGTSSNKKNKKATSGSASANINTNTNANSDGQSAGGRGRERDDGDDAESGGNKQPVKRLKITYGRD
ncbi:hypothetical protein GX48_07027 [Paracoccidioides brasiliensis]|nr:hypothetical protein GX48_07027 [Paracoccidioides brasiliensis]